MLKWTDLKRSSDTILAVWPEYMPMHDRWFMQELVYRDKSAPKWRNRLIPDEVGHVKVDHYPNRELAVTEANRLNPWLTENFTAHLTVFGAIQSLILKVDKALQSKRRLQDEEALMLSEARRRHQKTERVNSAFLDLHPEAEIYRQELAQQLSIMPYLKIVKVGRSNSRWNQLILIKNAQGAWPKPYSVREKGARLAERAKIAHGFGLDPEMHWGKVKAEIRQILLPRANKLLQLASVQRLLAEALARGEHVLVSNGIVFWYEKDGQVGWLVKETSSSRESEKAAIWKEGTIHSTNHGRLVILPYIKESGEHIRGHTKNGSKRWSSAAAPPRPLC